MRTIEALPLANQAPLIDPARRQTLLTRTTLVLALLANVVAMVGCAYAILGDAAKPVLPLALVTALVGITLTVISARLARTPR